MLDSEQLLVDLTQPQREAVTHVDKPLLIIAAAGSGKTRVLTRRVAWLISLGIPASSVLAITFTNKAAGEMKSRVQALLGRNVHDFGKLDQPWPTICTFHSLGLRILRHYADRIGLPVNFSIYDSSDQSKLVKDAIKSLDLSTENFPASMVHGKISDLKSRLLTPPDAEAHAKDYFNRTIVRVYKKYQELLAANNALDFDDLLMRTVHAFRDRQDMLAELQERYQYILIDEYQDTNHAQYIMAHAMALKHRNICVVGDPDQSIYAWRGADIKNILEFEEDYPDAKVVRLEQNYRSTKRILSIASRLIANNRLRKKKDLWTENAEGEKATLFVCHDEHAEAQAVMRAFRELNENRGLDWSKMAVFYRINSLSRVVEDAFRKANIPYRMARGVDFYNRKEIKDVLAYLRVIANPDDQVSLERIVNTPARGISDATVRQLLTHAIAHNMSLWGAVCEAPKIGHVSPRAAKACRAFVEKVIGWREQADQPGGASIRDLMEKVVRESGLEEYYAKIGDEEQEQRANIGELISAAAEYDAENPEGSLLDYLARVSLVSDVDALKDQGGAVTMMTLHAAKGLEFPVVAIVGLEEGCLPHARARNDKDQEEEERRLCFVGITRAQERLFLSWAKYRMFRGRTERTIMSPFINEMGTQDTIIKDLSDESDFGDRDDDSDDSPGRGSAMMRRGQLVRHRQFGIGRVLQVIPGGGGGFAIIQFDAFGRKTLSLTTARLEAI